MVVTLPVFRSTRAIETLEIAKGRYLLPGFNPIGLYIVCNYWYMTYTLESNLSL